MIGVYLKEVLFTVLTFNAHLDDLPGRTTQRSRLSPPTPAALTGPMNTVEADSTLFIWQESLVWSSEV